jgi:hypothetical protein
LIYERIGEREVNRRRPHVAVLKVDEDELKGSALQV